MAERIRQPIREVREVGQARFVFTPEASFFVPGTIRGGREDEGARDFRLAALHGRLLGRPIVTIPPEEAL